MSDLDFRISANIAELKKALAEARREIAGLGSTAGKKGVDGLNASIDKTAEAAQQAAKAAQAAAEKQARAIKAQAEEIRKLREEYDKLRKQQNAPAPAPKAPAPSPSTPRAPAQAPGQRNVAAQVAPQLTDIGVSLASGQNPLLVLLQQGGQLKDMFGGVLPALRAVGSTVAGLLSPVGLLVGAVGALGLAYLKGSEEALKLNRALLETGNSVGLAGSELVKYSQAIAKSTGGSQSGIVATLEQIVRSGKIAGSQVKLVAETATILSEKTGRDVAQTIADFSKIGDDPVKGARELNKQYNFLTGSTLAQVRALQQQGRTQEAAKLVAEAYADAMKDRAPEVEKNIGIIERAWNKVKKATTGAISELAQVGRAPTSSDFQQQIDALQARIDNPKGADNLEFIKEGNRKQIAFLKVQRDLLAKGEQEEATKANKQAAQNRAASIQEDLADEAQQYETAGERRLRLRTQLANKTANGIADATIAADEAAAQNIAKARDQVQAALDRDAARSAAAVVQINAGSVREAADRGLVELDRLYAEGEVSLERFLERKKALQLQGIDAELKAARAERAAVIEPEDRARVEANVLRLQRQRSNVEKDIQFERTNLERDTNNQLLELRAQQLEQQGRLEEAAALRFEQQYRTLRNRLLADRNQAGVDALDQVKASQQAALKQQTTDQVTELKARQLESEGQLEQAFLLRIESQYRELRKRLANDPDGMAVVDNLVNTERAQVRFQELRALMDREVAAMQGKLVQIEQAVATGGMTSAEGQAASQAARATAIEQLTVLNTKMQELAASTNDPAIKQGAIDSANAIRDLAINGAGGLSAAIISLNLSLDNMGKAFASNAANAGVDALSNLFVDLVSGTKSAKEALKDFVVGFVQSMAQIAARALATYLVLQLLNAIPGGAAVAAAMDVGARVKHGGGKAGHGTTRRVDPAIFAGAPRFHSGGMVPGLKPGEVPAILQEGERVQSRQEVAAGAGGGNGAGNGYRIVNVVDPSMVEGFLQSSAGERTVLNVISRNAGQVRQTIGK